MKTNSIIGHATSRATNSDTVRPTQVICSVSDLNGLPLFIQSLAQLIPEINFYCTSGTKTQLERALPSDYHRHLIDIYHYISPPAHSRDIVKTLDWRIFLGILADPANTNHQQAIRKSKVQLFDMVIVNCYQKIIDIGGPALLRAAAKNSARVLAVSSPRQYPKIISELRNNDGLCGIKLRRALARRVFRFMVRYSHSSLRLIRKMSHEY